MKILIGCVGAQNSINVLQSLLEYKKKNNIYMKLVGMDTNPINPAIPFLDCFHVVPKSSDPCYLSTIYDIIKKEDINIFIPVHSAEIEFFSKHKKEFHNKTGIQLCIPDYDTFRQVDDKLFFHLLCVRHNLKIPWTMELGDVEVSDLIDMKDKLGLNFLIKKRKGSGTKNIWFIENGSDIDRFYENLSSKEQDYIVQEFLNGPEYTIDFVSGFDGVCLGLVIRERIDVRDGKCVKGKTVVNDDIRDEIMEFLDSIQYIGAGNIQGFYHEGNFFITECNPRFSAGGLPLTIKAGLDIPVIIMQLVDNPDRYIPFFYNYEPNIFMCRYYTESFL